MAIKEWTTNYPANIDTNSNQPTLINDADASRVSQMHAMRAAVQGLEAQVGSNNIEASSLRAKEATTRSGLGEELFVWNDTDLTQFDTTVLGEKVTASDVAVVSFQGLNWVKVESTASSGNNAISGAVVVPITKTWSEDDFLILADWVNIERANSIVGVELWVRYNTVDISGDKPYEGYFVLYNNPGSLPQISLRLAEHPGGVPGNPQLGVNALAEPGTGDTEGGDDSTGMTLACSVEGQSLVKMSCGENYHVAEGGTYTSGTAAFGVSPVAVASQRTRSYFRNIRVLTIPRNIYM